MSKHDPFIAENSAHKGGKLMKEAVCLVERCGKCTGEASTLTSWDRQDEARVR